MSEFVEERMGPTAGAAVRTMLTETRGQEQSVAEKASGEFVRKSVRIRPIASLRVLDGHFHSGFRVGD